MVRQSISLTKPNDTWLKSQLETKEYNSKSDVVNDLIRHARAKQEEIEKIREILIKAEQSGFVTQTKEEILAEFKNGLKPNAI
jgi:antitoxin ParD1/3/4